MRAGPGQRLQVESDRGYIRALADIVNQMLEQMETLMQGVRRVSDNIAHDLRTPLTRMRNNLSQLRDRPGKVEAGQLDRIIEECDDLLASFNALLRISELEARLKKEPIREIVIALGTDVEGDATAFYLAKRLARPDLKVTRIAHGLPAGSGLEFADELTLSRALEGRREMQ